jgi:hypothetical protein
MHAFPIPPLPARIDRLAVTHPAFNLRDLPRRNVTRGVEVPAGNEVVKVGGEVVNAQRTPPR